MKIEWKDSCCIGNVGVDMQHKHVFAIAGELEKLTGKPEQRLAVMRLYQHVRQHFKDEEMVMRDVGFPLYAEHVEAHNKILTNLNRVSQQVAATDSAGDAIAELLKDWALNHIASADVELAGYIKNLLE